MLRFGQRYLTSYPRPALVSRMMASSSSSSKPEALPSLQAYAKLPDLKGMKTIDKSAFSVNVPFISARVPASKVGELRRHPMLYGQLMDIPKITGITSHNESLDKLLRLRATAENQIPSPVKAFFNEHGVSEYVNDSVELGYDHWNASEILSAVLPEDVGEETPSSFTQIGHIAHLNLRDEWLPYKHLIGQVILDKNAMIRTVVNKLDTIHAEYRYFDMEVIAGEPDFITTVNESNCSFTLDFREVYWNSRLHHEHERLVNSFKTGDVIADVMAGVGPFAIPAAKKGCRVLANDLNPDGVKWMEVNKENNKIGDNLIITNIDGREFIKSAPTSLFQNRFPPVKMPLSRKQKDQIAKASRKDRVSSTHATQATSPSDLPNGAGSSIAHEQPSSTGAPEDDSGVQEIDHFIMNLPDSALTFLDAYQGCYTPLLSQETFHLSKEEVKMPMVHVHCFTRELDPEAAQQDIIERASKYLAYQLSPDQPDYNLHLVRSVAPNKHMYCLSFRLPREVAFKEV